MKAIEVENLSKQYRLGTVGSGTLREDLSRWWHRVRGKEDPLALVGEVNDRTKVANSDFVWALKDINFSVQQGEVLGIIGRNGAGKSTLLKILSKTTAPTSGNVKINGRIASLLEVGTGFHPELTGRENIYLNGAILGMRKTEITRKLDEIISFAGVERYTDTPVKRYSSGMYVRLAFAVAAHLESEILIIDEVLAVGDAEFQKKCLGKMNSIATKEGRTVLFVSHNNNAISQLSTVGLYMKNGSIKSYGLINQCLDDYLIEDENFSKKELSDFYDSEKPNITSMEMLYDDLQNGVMEFDFEFKSPYEMDSPSIGILITDYLDRPIVGTNNRIHNQQTKKGFYKSGKISLRIAGLYLIPGNYKISLFLGDAFTDIRIYPNILTFNYNNPIIQSTQIPDAKYIGSIYLKDVIWKMNLKQSSSETSNKK